MPIVQKEKIDWNFILPLILGNMMNPLNSTMLSTALVTICNQFARGVGAGALLITPLYIAAAIGQPLMGRLADIYSPKAINRLGFILVLFASAIGALAPDFSWLIVSRVILGLGTSAAYPSAMALTAQKYQNNERAIPGNVLAVMAVSSQVSMVIGPLLGGFVTQALGWRGVFLINIPWVLTALYLSRVLPAGKKNSQKRKNIFSRVDGAGIAIFAFFLTFLMLVLTSHVGIILGVSAILILLSAFVLWEKKSEAPFIDVRLFWLQPSLLLIYVRTLATNYILYLLLYAFPQWIEGAKMLTPAETGLVTFPMSLMSIISAMSLSKTKNLFIMNTVGIIAITLASCAAFLLWPGIPIYGIVGVTMLAGVGTGVNLIANQSSLSAEVPAEKTGVSFGLYRTFGYLGAIISGTQLKNIFHNGVQADSIQIAGTFALTSCVVLALLYFPIARLDRQRARSL